MPESGVDVAVETAVASTLERVAGPVVLAVSGGADSMALLDVAARVAADRVAAVATFDHGTGPASREAVSLVQRAGRRYGLDVVAGATETVEQTEAAWRRARWGFLRTVAAACEAFVATGHTRDDQVETIVIRVLRDAGARGLAGLDVDSDVVRPLLGVSRSNVRAYAMRAGLEWVEDPSNASAAFLRNRVRHELLPAIRVVRPGFDGEMLDMGGRAAELRRELERFVTERCIVRRTADGLSVAVADLARYDHETVAVLWPVLAARAGVTLDRRGTARLAAFTFKSKVGGTIQLSGGVSVVRSRFFLVIRTPW